MIRLRNASKVLQSAAGSRVVLDTVSAVLPRGHSIALLSRTPGAASCLFDLFAGATELDSGSIRVDAAISWPLGRKAHPFKSMTIRDAATFVARMYGQDTARVVAFLRDFAEIGSGIDKRFSRESHDVRTRVQLALALSIEFDCYLLESLTLHRNPAFQAKVWEALGERLAGGASLIVGGSRQTRPLIKACDMGVVLVNGEMMIYDDIREAVRAFKATSARRSVTAPMRLEGHPA